MLSPPHQYLWQARTPAQLCRGRCRAELGAAHRALLREQENTLLNLRAATLSFFTAPAVAFGEGAILCTYRFPFVMGDMQDLCKHQ